MRPASFFDESSREDRDRNRDRRGRPSLANRRRKQRRRAALESLEPRTLLSILPAPLVGTSTLNVSNPGQNADPGTLTGRVNESSPSLAVNPLNRNLMVMVYTQYDPSPPGTTTTNAFFRVSTNGGVSWGGATQVSGVLLDPSSNTDPAQRTPFAQVTDAQVAFDRDNNFYVITSQHNAGNTEGVLLLNRWSFSGGVPTRTLNNQVVTSWTDLDGALLNQVVRPFLAVDANAPSFNDPDTGAAQGSPNSGAVYIAWSTIDEAPPDTPNWNPNAVRLVASANGGASFAGPITLNDNGNNLQGGSAGLNNARHIAPQIVVSQGTAGGSVAGGLLTVVWEDFNALPANGQGQRSRILADRVTFDGVALTSSLNTVVGTTTVQSVAPGAANPLGYLGAVASAANPLGIGPGVVAAVDNTLGSFSPYQGRIYVAFTDRDTTAAADNTDIWIKASDNGGLSWSVLANPFPNAPDGSGAFPIAEGNDTASVRVNRDDAFSDGYSAARVETLTGRALTGRPQFGPSIAVDQATGMVVLSWYDARHDASGARVARYVGASITGGQTFTAETFVNDATAPTDLVNREVVNLGPIPDNLSAGNANAGTAIFGFGVQQALYAHGGLVLPAWSSNRNADPSPAANPNFQGGTARLDIRLNRVTLPGGPRIINGTQGPVEGGAGSLTVTFDRRVDPATFTFDAGTGLSPDIQLLPRDVEGNPLPAPRITGITPLNGNALGATVFRVDFNTWTTPGTISYVVGPDVRDRIRQADATGSVLVSAGNLMDQDGDAVPGETNDDDLFDVPRRLDPIGQNRFNAPYVRDSLPIIIPGPQVIDSQVPGGTNQADNLALNRSVSALDVTFDRPMRVDTFTAEDVLRVQGPAGVVPGPYTVTPVFGPNLAANLNTPIGNGGLVLSSLTIPAADVNGFTIADVNVRLDITHNQPETLRITLIRNPGGGEVRIPLTMSLPAQPGRDFRDTVLDDEAAVDLASARGPYTGTFRPAGGSLAALDGLDLAGDWALEIIDGNAADGAAGTLNHWSIEATPADPTAASARNFRVGVPRQVLSGTYNVVLGDQIASFVGGFLMDANRDAGLSALRQIGTLTAPEVFNAGSLPLALLPGETATSTILVDRNFVIQDVNLGLNINHPNVRDLVVTLIAPNGDRIRLARDLNPGANFAGTTFDDEAAQPIDAGFAPFAGSFRPQEPLDALDGRASDADGGLYTLEIVNNSATLVGSLTGWSLTMGRAVVINGIGDGLGEGAADRTSLDFRVFTMAAEETVASSVWTPIGPTGLDGGPQGVLGADRSGQVSAIAVDPSDPTGNTVYIGGGTGGVWKTTNFLTADPHGPTWIPLTDFGPNLGLNIGTIAIHGRNNDPNQSIIFAATGGGTTGQNGSGMLRSLDGGATWQLLGGLGNPLANTVAHQIAIDPKPLPGGGVIVLAALESGLWRSTDTGNTWTRVLTGPATSVAFDPTSGTVEAGNPNGNLQTVYAGIRGQGVFRNVNGGIPGSWALINGGLGNPLVRSADSLAAIPVNNTAGVNPNGAGGKILLAKPTLATGADATRQNLFYKGWLYAAVARNGTIELYLTKDQGQNWTRVALPNAGTFTPSNTGADIGLNNALASLTIDPTNPNVVFLGTASSAGTTNNDGTPTSPILIRVDTRGLHDPYAFYVDHDLADGGAIGFNITGPTDVNNTVIDTPPAGPYDFDPRRDAFLNLQRNPDGSLGDLPLRPANGPFDNASIYVNNIASFSNSGAGAKWITYERAFENRNNLSARQVTYGLHALVAVPDATTGRARLIFGTNQGIGTDIDGSAADLGTAPVLVGPRDGNLQITQFFYGAASPSSTRLGGAAYGAQFYGSTQLTGGPQSGVDVINTGDLNWTGLDGATGFVATNPQGNGSQYQYWWPGGTLGTLHGGNTNDFFQVAPTGQSGLEIYRNNPLAGLFLGQVAYEGFGLYNGGAISRTTGLFDAEAPGAQWQNAIGNAFAVNPRNAQQFVISDFAGQLFRTQDGGLNWSEIGPVSNGEAQPLDGSLVGALAYGAPTGAQLDAVIYAGTNNGNVWLTTNGGASWTNTATSAGGRNGLDGSAIREIYTNPTSAANGNREVYVVTAGGANRTFAGGGGGTAIPDNGVLTVSASVPDAVYIGDLNVTVSIAHTAVGQLTLTLIAPDGTRVALASNRGGTGDNFTNTVFDDQAGTAISAGAAPFTGSFRPEQTLVDRLNLATLYGRNTQGTWQLEVRDNATGETGTLQSWSINVTSLGGLYHRADANSAWRGASDGLFRITHDVGGQAEPLLGPVWSMAADWRYTLPSNPSVPGLFTTPGVPVNHATSHPVLYVAGRGGVFRSLDDGRSWLRFPDEVPGTLDFVPDPFGAGGGMPNVEVRDLSMALGKVDPSTGRELPEPGDPNLLSAFTFGRGAFAIRLAPVVLPGLLALHPINPDIPGLRDGGSDTGNDNGGAGTPPGFTDKITREVSPYIAGYSQQTDFGTTTLITLYDLSDPDNPRYIGGYNPDASNPAATVGLGRTDRSGRLAHLEGGGTALPGVRVLAGLDRAALEALYPNDPAIVDDLVARLPDGLVRIGVRALDQPSGTPGPIAVYEYTLDTTPPVAPPAPDLTPDTDGPLPSDPTFIPGVTDEDDVTNFNNGPLGPPAFFIGTEAMPVENRAAILLYRTPIDPDTGLQVGPTLLVNRVVDVNPVNGVVRVPDINTDFVVDPTDGIIKPVARGIIPDGTYLYTARLLDVAGNLGPVGPALRIVIETDAPVAAAPDLTDATDSGRPRTPDADFQRERDDLTRVVRPDFQGYILKSDGVTPEPGAFVQLFVRGIAAGSGFTDADGYYLITATVPLLEGPNAITVQPTDTTGNLGAISPALIVTLDTTAPAPIRPMLDPADDSGRSDTDLVTAVNTPRFLGNDAEPFALIRYFAEVLDAAGLPTGEKYIVGEVVADAAGTYVLTTGQYVRPLTGDPDADLGDPLPPEETISFLVDGRYAITAIQYDVAGNPSREAGFGVPGTVIIDGTDANDHGGRFSNVNVDGWAYIEKALNNIGPNVANGNVTIAALGMDPGQGTFGDARGAIYWSFADSILPSLGWNLVYVAKPDIDAFLSGQDVTGRRYTTGTTIIDVPGYNLFDDAGVLYITTVNNTTGDLDTADLAVINQRGDDIAAFVNGGGGLFSHGETSFNPAVPSYGWLTSIFPGLIVVDDFGFANDIQITPEGMAAFPGLTPADLSTGPWHNYFTGDLGDLVVLATDLLNDGSARVPLILTGGTTPPESFILVVDTGDPAAPLVPDLQPLSDTPAPGAPGFVAGVTDTDDLTADTTPTFDVSGVEVRANLELLRDGVVVKTLFNVAGGTVAITDDEPGVPGDGVYVYTARQTDVAGNVSPISGGLTVTIDTTPPAAPAAPDLQALSDTPTPGAPGHVPGASDTDNVTFDTTPTFDVAGVEARATLQLLRDGLVVETLVDVAGGTVAITDPGTPANGTFVYTVRQYDRAGNLGPVSAGLSVTIDTTPPEVTSAPDLQALSDSPLPGTPGYVPGITDQDNRTIVTNPTFDVSGVEPNATLQLLRNGVVVRTLANVAGGTVAINDPGVPANGTYLYTTRQYDLAGNEGPISPPLSVLIDTTQIHDVDNVTINLVPADDSGLPDDPDTLEDLITNVVRPRFEGNADFGVDPRSVSVVWLATNGVSLPSPITLGTVLPQPNNRYLVRSTVDLPDGVITVQARVRDSRDLIAYSLLLNITIDTSGPLEPPTLRLRPEDDNLLPGDNITSRRRPVFEGTTEPGALVELIDTTGAVRVSGRADAGGYFGLTLPQSLRNGALTLRARTRDIANNPGAISDPLTIHVVSVADDYDGDGRSDAAVFRSTTTPGLWSIIPSGGSGQYNVAMGRAGDIPILGDFDGDGRADLALWTPSTSTFTIEQSTLGLFQRQLDTFGTDRPAVADYDGDGKADVAIYNADWSFFLVIKSGGGAVIEDMGVPPGGIPVPADYDGDGKADFAVFHQNTASWTIKLSSTGQFLTDPRNGSTAIQFGAPSNVVANPDIPVPGDYDGDGFIDLAVFRQPTAEWFFWYVGPGGLETRVNAAGNTVPNTFSFQFGGSVTFLPKPDVPTPGDYNGDGIPDLSIYRQSNTGQYLTWLSSRGTTSSGATWNGWERTTPLSPRQIQRDPVTGLPPVPFSPPLVGDLPVQAPLGYKLSGGTSMHLSFAPPSFGGASRGVGGASQLGAPTPDLGRTALALSTGAITPLATADDPQEPLGPRAALRERLLQFRRDRLAALRARRGL